MMKGGSFASCSAAVLGLGRRKVVETRFWGVHLFACNVDTGRLVGD